MVTQINIKRAEVAAPRLGVKRLSDSAQIPTYGSAGAACFDLYAADTVAIQPGKAGTVSTKVAFEIPDDHVMLVFSRSGHGFKNGVRLSNCTGVVDSDYRGEVMVRLHNEGIKDFLVTLGDRVAQALVLPVARFDLFDVETLTETQRGDAGFGSTGK